MEIVATRLADLLQSRKQAIPVILDTVFAPSQGPAFSSAATISALREQLFPLCEWITPNVPEAARLLGHDLVTEAELAPAAQRLYAEYGIPYILLKGGHLPAAAERREAEAIDLLFDGPRQQLKELHAPRILGYEVRGTGCLLASAIAAQRAHGEAAEPAALRAKLWLHDKIEQARIVGKGRRIAT